MEGVAIRGDIGLLLSKCHQTYEKKPFLGRTSRSVTKRWLTKKRVEATGERGVVRVAGHRGTAGGKRLGTIGIE